jgi:hypothetical protein
MFLGRRISKRIKPLKIISTLQAIAFLMGVGLNRNLISRLPASIGIDMNVLKAV